MFFGFSLSTLMIFPILNLYYAYNMLEIIESVVSHEIVITISEGSTRVYHGKNSGTAIWQCSLESCVKTSHQC